VIGLPIPPADRDNRGGPNGRWIREDLTPLTMNEAYARYFPLLEAAWADSDQVAGRWFYACRNFDREARLCMVQGDKPPCCSGFPWYGTEPRFGKLAPYPRCSFHADVEALGLHIKRGEE